MRILIDIGHPAHVHLFRPFAQEMEKQGHVLLFTYRQKEFESELLEAAGFQKKSFGPHYNTKAGKIWGLFKFNWLMFRAIRAFKPDLLLSHGSLYAAQMAWLSGKPHLSLEDSGNMEQILLYRPFTQAILAPDVLPEQLGPKEIRYKAYHELFYLHPDYFRPDFSRLSPLGLKEGEPFVILRLVSFNATHDIGHAGFTREQKEQIVSFLEGKYRLFISSESELPEHLKKYQIKLPPHLIHHALYFASFVVSEGATVASEAGVLGTPAFYVNSIARSYNEDQERFGLVYNFRNGLGVLDKIIQFISGEEVNKSNEERRKPLLEEKINPTKLLLWTVLNWPNSVERLKKDEKIRYSFSIK